MTMHEILTGGLPTKWSKAIAGMTLIATPSVYNVPSLLPLTWLPNSPEQIFLIRLLLSVSTLLLGSWIVLLLVVRAFHNLASQHVVEIEKLKANKPPMRIDPEFLRRI